MMQPWLAEHARTLDEMKPLKLHGLANKNSNLAAMDLTRFILWSDKNGKFYCSRIDHKHNPPKCDEDLALKLPRESLETALEYFPLLADVIHDKWHGPRNP